MAKKPRGAKGTEDDKPEICQVRGCHGVLRHDGYCENGGGWPFYVQKQPTVCPDCREPLSWSGNCHRCWNRYREIGPGFYHEEENGHWVSTDKMQRMFGRLEFREKFGEVAEFVDAEVPF